MIYVLTLVVGFILGYGYFRIFKNPFIPASIVSEQPFEAEAKKLDVSSHVLTILDGMVEGVFVTNQRGEIVLANPALCLILQIDESVIGKTVLECFRHAAIHQSIEQVLSLGKPQEVEIETMISGEERCLVVHVAPLLRESEIVGSVSVFNDVTQIRKLENMRREFVANVSHELKTPLTSILGYSETLLDGALDKDDKEVVRRFVGKIQNNALQLQNLVQDILKLSEIESGRFELNIQPVRLKDFVDELVQEFEGGFENKVPEGTLIMVDPKVLKQILTNLLTNALKYTPEGGLIEVNCVMNEGRPLISVKDTGIGISEKDLGSIFERFYRVDKARSRSMGGTGLGLAIVKHLVQSHGGELGVESVLGEGSRFYFTLGKI